MKKKYVMVIEKEVTEQDIIDFVESRGYETCKLVVVSNIKEHHNHLVPVTEEVTMVKMDNIKHRLVAAANIININKPAYSIKIEER